MPRKIRRKANYFQNGGFDKSNLGFNKNNFNSGLFNSAISVVGGAAGNAISGGLSSGAGNAISGLGDIASAIPGPWGAVANAGLKTIGGLVNAAFGSQINEQAVADAKALNSSVANTQFSSSNTDDILAQSNFGLAANLRTSDIGKDGWFANKAANLTKDLNKQRLIANQTALANFSNAIDKVEQNNLDLAMSNYKANGGPLNMRYTGVMSPFGSRFDEGGPLTDDQYYNIMDKVAQKNYRNWGFNTSDEALIYALNNNTYDYRGYYNKYPNSSANAVTHWTDEFKTVYHPTFSNESIYSGKKSEFNPKGLIGGYWKGETFIPAKWQERRKAFGGKLSTNGAEWGNGLTVIGNGGTHEENPLDGVQMGVDNQGVPNLVEEGEVIYDDYVYSDRLKVPKDFKKTYKLGNKDITFAEAAEKMSKESEERPNDPISKAGLKANLQALQQKQEEVRMKNEAAKAQAEFDSLPPEQQLGIMEIAQQAAQQQAMMQDPNAQQYAKQYPNQQEMTPEEVAMAEQSMMDPNALGGTMFAYGGRRGNMFDGSGKSENILFSPYLPKTTDGYITHEDLTPPSIKASDYKEDYTLMELNPNHINNAYGINGAMGSNYSSKPKPTTKQYNSDYRYAPIVNDAVNILTDALGITNKPNYERAESIEREMNNQRPNLISAPQLGDYITYKPIDLYSQLNALNAASGAAVRNVFNTSAGNRGAALTGLLTLNDNLQSNVGKVLTNAANTNYDRLVKARDFNRNTNIANAESAMKAAMANQSELNALRAYRMNALNNAAGYREQARLLSDNNITTNRNNFISNIANVGWENFNRNSALNNPYLRYWQDDKGIIHFKHDEGK